MTSTAMPKTRPGRRPIMDPSHLTPCERRLLQLISRQGELHGVAQSKHDMAEQLGCCVKTVDRAVASLRRRALIEAAPRFSETGGQLSNMYRVTLLAQRTYPDLLG